jgi:serine/threonine protein kinase
MWTSQLMPLLVNGNEFYGRVLRRVWQLAHYVDALPAAICLPTNLDWTLIPNSHSRSMYTIRCFGTLNGPFLGRGPLLFKSIGFQPKDKPAVKAKQARVGTLSVLPNAATHSLNGSQRFYAHILLNKYLVHPNIMACYGAMTHVHTVLFVDPNEQGKPSMVMPLAPYPTLLKFVEAQPGYDRLKLVRIPTTHVPGHLLTFGLQLRGVGRGLGFLHSLGIVHSDVKQVRPCYKTAQRTLTLCAGQRRRERGGGADAD